MLHTEPLFGLRHSLVINNVLDTTRLREAHETFQKKFTRRTLQDTTAVLLVESANSSQRLWRKRQVLKKFTLYSVD